ncbi:RNA ligase family protein [Aliikangiella coralliicola]|nr:RNA ligase family protein [Aliikangiella coralliicola]
MFIKCPKTLHIEEVVSSDICLLSLAREAKAGDKLHMIVEEKMDGSQVGISFGNSGELKIQSRGAYVSSEPEFSLLKQWAWQHYAALFSCLSNRYILFGEWLFAKHTMYYDLLPDYFMEFDIFDRRKGVFLSTNSRQEILKETEFISSVRVIGRYLKPTLRMLKDLIGASAFISERKVNQLKGSELRETDITGLMEGLYLKVENDAAVLGRYKLIRPEFIEKIVTSGSHWKSRDVKVNQLKPVESN